jgi:hypothetical protein
MPFRFLLTFFRTGLPTFPSLSNSFMTEKWLFLWKPNLFF